MSYLLIQSDARSIPLADRSVHCVVTSPPYYSLRDYGVAGQLGLEATPDAYVAAMVGVFREVWRVLRDDGTCWVNIGDSYAGGKIGRGDADRPNSRDLLEGKRGFYPKSIAAAIGNQARDVPDGLKPKDLIGIPWRLAFALQADGWYLRSDVVWHKPNPMPESVRDRPTKAHEYVFLLAKRERYFYDGDAVRQPHQTPGEFVTEENKRGDWMPGAKANGLGGGMVEGGRSGRNSGRFPRLLHPLGANARSVWTINPHPFPGAHFATMPVKLAAKCIKAGSPRGGIVFDPFAGAGTTLVAATALGRHGIGCDLKPSYLAMAARRIERPHAPKPRAQVEEAPLPLFARMAP